MSYEFPCERAAPSLACYRSHAVRASAIACRQVQRSAARRSARCTRTTVASRACPAPRCAAARRLPGRPVWRRRQEEAEWRRHEAYKRISRQLHCLSQQRRRALRRLQRHRAQQGEWEPVRALQVLRLPGARRSGLAHCAIRAASRAIRACGLATALTHTDARAGLWPGAVPYLWPRWARLDAGAEPGALTLLAVTRLTASAFRAHSRRAVGGACVSSARGCCAARRSTRSTHVCTQLARHARGATTSSSVVLLVTRRVL